MVDDEPEDPAQKWIDAFARGDSAALCPTSPRALPDPATAEEATALLARFRPARSSPADLARLLERRADPNLQPGDLLNAQDIERHGSDPPLQNVLDWAGPENITPMRQLLLDYGATNTRELDLYWKSKVSYYKHEKVWLRQFHEDPRGEFQNPAMF